MRLSDKIANWNSMTPFYSFEFFPPRTEQGFENLVSRIERLSKFNPLAVSITWGAGGSTKDWSLRLADICRNDHEVNTIMHLTCTNMQVGTVEDALRSAREKGIRNILALRGDPPRGEDHWIPSDPRFTSGLDLVKFIKSTPEFRDYFCVGVAGYPDGHAESTASEEEQIRHLKAKVDAGADFIITQLFYDADSFLSWQSKAQSAGITVPIIPGLMPVQTYASFMRVTKLCNTRVPEELLTQINTIKHDDELVKELGVEVTVAIIRKLQQNGVQGFHFCTLNLEKSVQKVLETLGWIGYRGEEHNLLISESPNQPMTIGSLPPDMVITASDVAASASYKLHHQIRPGSGANNTAGKGELLATTTWDEFPNGRFGDAKSPAFGVNDLWDNGLGVSPADALAFWGRPTKLEDITSLFVRYLKGEAQSTPWSDSPLLSESIPISPHLLKLNAKGWWTVASQPAVDSAPSEDETYGWGPRGGYVFQKAFVEFFCTREDVMRIESKLITTRSEWVTYFAANMLDEYSTNMDEGSNAVTWGVFPGKEISSPTIIERDSFLAWKDEAFGYWTQWGLVFPPDSPERKLLEQIRDERWLVSVVHHNYKDADALWTFLLSN